MKNQRHGGARHVLRTMLVTGMAYVFSYGIMLVLTPYITDTIGTEAYGFVTLAKQFTVYRLCPHRDHGAQHLFGALYRHRLPRG